MAVGKASSGSGKNIASTSNTSGKASSVSTGKNVSTNGNVGKANSSGLGKNINPSAGTAGKAINTTGKKNVVPNSMMDIATPPAINPVPGSAPSGVVAVELTPKQRRMQGLTAVRNDFDNGIVYTYLTKQLLASDLTVEQGNIIAKALAISPIYLEQLPFNAAYTVSKFKNIA
jgi:hypothetical protein